MSRISDKHGLTNKYREHGSKRLVKRGRARTSFKTTKSKTIYPVGENQLPQANEQKVIIIGVSIFALLILFAIIFIINVGFNSHNEPALNTITLNQLQNESHPKIADNEELVEQYYSSFGGVAFEHASSFKSNTSNVLTWYYTSIYTDNVYHDLVIDFSNLTAAEQEQLTFEKVLDIAIGFVPIDEILQYYDFDKAIYVEREDHIAHEIYYKEKSDVTMPAKYSDEHGFAIVIKEYSDGYFKVFIDTSWYDYVYDLNPIGRIPVSQEELDSHQNWEFSLEKYINK